MAFRRRSIESPHVDLTPMIDVVFLLLIFFMITTTFIESPGLTINLPKSSAQQLKRGEKDIHVYLTAEGAIYLQKQPVSLEELRQRIQQYGETVKQMTFLLMADKGALHGRVIQLMDAAKTAGFGRLAIATDKERDE